MCIFRQFFAPQDKTFPSFSLPRPSHFLASIPLLLFPPLSFLFPVIHSLLPSPCFLIPTSPVHSSFPFPSPFFLSYSLPSFQLPFESFPVILLFLFFPRPPTCKFIMWHMWPSWQFCKQCLWVLVTGSRVGWGLTALLTQNRSYRACKFVGRLVGWLVGV